MGPRTEKGPWSPTLPSTVFPCNLRPSRESLSRRLPARASSLTNFPSSFEMLEISTVADDCAAATVRPGG